MYEMDKMYRLHYAPDNASFIIRVALEELGLPYETALVDRSTRAQDAPAYRKLNPAGLIPVLETPQGPIFETGAILLWLADRHPGPLLPPPDSPYRGDALKWLFFLSNTLHPALRMLFYPEKYIGPDPALQKGLRQHMQAEFLRLVDLVEAGRMADAPGDQLASDVYLACLLRWMAIDLPGAQEWFALGRWPRIETLCRSLDARPAVQRAQQAEGLGPRPFSAPRLPVPPEGART